MSDSREYILSKIKARENRERLEKEKPDISSQIYKEIFPDKLQCFKNELETVSGICTVCNSEKDAYQKLEQYLKQENIDAIFCKDSNIQKNLTAQEIKFRDSKDNFENMQAAVTPCEFLVARTGSVIVSSQGESGRQLNFFPPTHIVLAKKTQLVDYPEDGLKAIQEKYRSTELPSQISFISGPSRTADIEKTLVLGAHGPKCLHVFIYE